MLKGLFVAIMVLSSSLSAKVIDTYTDIESYPDATARLGRAPLVSDFLRYDMQVAQEIQDTAATPGGPIVISRFGTTEPETPVIVEPEPPTIDPKPVSPPAEVIVVDYFSRTSRQQMNGCLDRWNNQLNASEITTVLNSISAMFDDKEIINNCIEDIRAVIKAQQ